MTMRYVCKTAVGLQNITFQNLLDTVLFATSATAVYDVFVAVKVRRIRVWFCTASNTTAPASITVIYAGITSGAIGDQRVHSDTTMGIEPAYLEARPTPKSLASNFQLSSTAVAFSLNVPAGAVIDVDLSFIGAFASSIAAAVVGAGATTGATYLRGLDGGNVASSSFPPSLPTGDCI
jgi:hypothetical protein